MTGANGPLVAIVNTSPEVIELLRATFEDEGFLTMGSMFTSAAMFKREERDLEAFLAREDPVVVVWDVALPYEENWRYFQDVRRAGSLDGRGVVLTTTNKRVLEELVGPTSTIEVVGKPFDLQEIIDAVRRVLPTAAAT